MTVPHQPLPEKWEIQQATDQNGQPWVIVRIHSPNGTHVSFMDVDGAANIARLIADEATQAGKPRLVLPTGGLITPNGHG